MSSLWVVLDAKSEKAVRRVGRVIEPEGDITAVREVTVEWPDRSVEKIEASASYLRMRIDGLKALKEFAPDQLQAELDSSPLLFARALADKPKRYVRAKELLELVVSTSGLDRSVVEKAWRRHRSGFESLPEVEVEPTASGAKYSLVAPLPPVDIEQRLNAAPDGQAQQLQPSETVIGQDLPSREPLLELQEEEPNSAVRDDQALAEQAEGEGVLDIPTALSVRNPPPVDSAALEAWFDSSGPGDAIAAGATELERLRSQPAVYVEKVAGFSLLVSRVLKRSEAAVPPEALARAFVALRRSDSDSDRRRGLEALDRLLPMLTKPTDFLSKIDRPAFQAALAELPFIADGPRVGLLVVLGRADASLLDDSSWWRGFGWSDILAISSTPLSALIAAREGLMNMVQVIADQTAAEVTTRSGLAVLLGGPRFALEHVSPATMRLVFDRVAKADGLLARWLDEISARPERERLAERVAETESQAREARQSEAKAREELDELSEQLADVQRQLAVLQEASVGLSTRERRQVFIDAAKVVAQVAATVEGDGRALDHDALSRKVGLLAERFGLQTDDLPGATVAFDPERHSAPGARPDVGEPVNVARAGYTWNDGSERVVVLPALVTRASQNGENGR